MSDAPAAVTSDRAPPGGAGAVHPPLQVGAARGGVVLLLAGLPMALAAPLLPAHAGALGLVLVASLAVVVAAEAALARAVRGASTGLGRTGPPWLVAALGLVATVVNLTYVEGALGGGPEAGVRAVAAGYLERAGALDVVACLAATGATALGLLRRDGRAGPGFVRALALAVALSLGLVAAVHAATATLSWGDPVDLVPRSLQLAIVAGVVIVVGVPAALCVEVLDALAEGCARAWWPAPR